jgi:tRNA modification GTPase
VPAVEIARALAAGIRTVLVDAPRGERLREGFVVAIAGPPNVGKSTLLNRLAERDVAIVSAIPGTTRDAIEVALDLKGVPVVLVDTAGVRETKDPVELEGVKRALARAAAADLVLWLTEAGAPSPAPPPGTKTIAVRTKADLIGSDLVDSEVQRGIQNKGSISISAKTGAGMERLLELLAREAEALGGEPALVTRERQRMALAEALKRLEAAVDIASKGKEELIAEELRMAANALGRVTGRIGVEEVLGEIFRSFCIGK